jgi:hypothetical protein
LAAIPNYPVGRKAKAAGGREDAMAPVSESVAIGANRDGWLDGEAIGDDEVGSA